MQSYPPPSYPPPPSNSGWLKYAIIGGMIGLSIVAAAVILATTGSEGGKNSQTSPTAIPATTVPSITSQPAPSQPAPAQPVPAQPVPVQPQPIPQQPTPQPQTPIIIQPIQPPPVAIPVPPQQPVSKLTGWMWLGNVGNTSNSFTTGEPLRQFRKQPITVIPRIVPQVGSTMTLVTGVNLRNTFPLPSTGYKLGAKVAELQPGQSVRVLQVTSIVDSTSDSPYTRIWAQVEL